jgi:hypothetical protein
MFKRLDTSHRFLYYLTELRKRLSMTFYGRVGEGFAGMLVKNKDGEICGCYVFPPSTCSPSPGVSKEQITKALYEISKSGFISAGWVVLNTEHHITPYASYIGGDSDEGIDSLREARKYTRRRSASVTMQGLAENLVIVDDENIPIAMSGTQFFPIKPKKRSTDKCNFFTQSKIVCDKLAEVVKKVKRTPSEEVILNGEVIS